MHNDIKHALRIARRRYADGGSPSSPLTPEEQALLDAKNKTLPGINAVTVNPVGGLTNTPVTALGNTPGGNDYGKFVGNLYQSDFGRPADTGGANYWTQQLQSGAATPQQVAQAFAASQEAQGQQAAGETPSTFISPTDFSKADLASMGLTEPTMAGVSNLGSLPVTAATTTGAGSSNTTPGTSGSLSTTGNQVSTNTYSDPATALKLPPNMAADSSFLPTLQQLQSGQAKIDPSNYGDFVTSLYNQNLGRSPDVSGQDYFLSKLQSGEMTPAQVAQTIASTPEAQQYNADQIGSMYQDLLGRQADQSGLDYWKNQISGGKADLNTVADTLLNSQEYLNSFNGNNIAFDPSQNNVSKADFAAQLLSGGLGDNTANTPGYVDPNIALTGGNNQVGNYDFAANALSNGLGNTTAINPGYVDPNVVSTGYTSEVFPTDFAGSILSGGLGNNTATQPGYVDPSVALAGGNNQITGKDFAGNILAGGLGDNTATQPGYIDPNLQMSASNAGKVNNLLNSFNPKDPNSYVTGLYNNLLGRQPDVSGQQYWAGKIQSGEMTPVQVAQAVAKAENVPLPPPRPTDLSAPTPQGTLLDSIKGALQSVASGNITQDAKSVLESALTGVKGVGSAAKDAIAGILQPGNGKDLAVELGNRLAQDYGLTQDQVAGVLAHFGHESAGFKSAVSEGKPLIPGSRGGYGYAQWTGPRRNALEKFAKDNGLDASKFITQYKFMQQEPEFKQNIGAVKKATTMEQAAKAFAPYESGGDPRWIANWPSRLAIGRQAQSWMAGASAPDQKPVPTPPVRDVPSTIPASDVPAHIPAGNATSGLPSSVVPGSLSESGGAQDYVNPAQGSISIDTGGGSGAGESSGGAGQGAALSGDGSQMVASTSTIQVPVQISVPKTITVPGQMKTFTGPDGNSISYQEPATTKTVMTTQTQMQSKDVTTQVPAWQKEGFQSQADYQAAVDNGNTSASQYYASPEYAQAQQEQLDAQAQDAGWSSYADQQNAAGQGWSTPAEEMAWNDAMTGANFFGDSWSGMDSGATGGRMTTSKLRNKALKVAEKLTRSKRADGGQLISPYSMMQSPSAKKQALQNQTNRLYPKSLEEKKEEARRLEKEKRDVIEHNEKFEKGFPVGPEDYQKGNLGQGQYAMKKGGAVEDALRLAKGYKSGGKPKNVEGSVEIVEEYRKPLIENYLTNNAVRDFTEQQKKEAFDRRLHTTSPHQNTTPTTPKVSPEEYQRGNLGRGNFALSSGGRAEYAVGGAPTDLTAGVNPAVDASNSLAAQGGAAAAPSLIALPDPNQSYVDAMYKGIMGRTPDQSGEQFWTNQLATGNVDPSTLVTNFANSPEFQDLYKKDPTKAISSLYQTTLGRAPDTSGQQYWENQAKGGMGLDAMIQGFQNSQEGQNVNTVTSDYLANTGLMPTTDQMTAAEQQLALGQDPNNSIQSSDAGLNYLANNLYEKYTGQNATQQQIQDIKNQLAQGVDPADIEANISNTPASNSYSINQTYQDILSRTPDAEGAKYWADQLNNGKLSIYDLQNSLGNSQEAKDYQNTQFIKDEFKGLLGYDPSPQQIQESLGQLNSGTTQADFDKALSSSDASQQYQASNFPPYQVADASGKVQAPNQPRTQFQTLDKLGNQVKDVFNNLTPDLQKYMAGLIGQESGGKPNPLTATAKTSNAAGMLQFIPRTWLDQFQKVFGKDTGLSKDQILNLRTNTSPQAQAINLALGINYMNEGKARLEKAGVPITPGSLYSLHFSGNEKLAKLAQSNPNAPATQALNAQQIRANSWLKKMTAGQAMDFMNNKMATKANLGQPVLDNYSKAWGTPKTPGTPTTPTQDDYSKAMAKYQADLADYNNRTQVARMMALQQSKGKSDALPWGWPPPPTPPNYADYKKTTPDVIKTDEQATKDFYDKLLYGGAGGNVGGGGNTGGTGGGTGGTGGTGGGVVVNPDLLGGYHAPAADAYLDTAANLAAIYGSPSYNTSIGSSGGSTPGTISGTLTGVTGEGAGTSYSWKNGGVVSNKKLINKALKLTAFNR
jgi:hypothetical protein